MATLLAGPTYSTAPVFTESTNFATAPDTHCVNAAIDFAADSSSGHF